MLFRSSSSGTTDDRGVVAIELVFAEELADFHLDEVEELGVVDEVNFVEPNNDLGNAHLTSEKDMFASLRHRAVSGGNNEDRAVHLSGTSDHILDEVGMARAIDVRIVALFRLVFDVSDRDRDDLGSIADGAALCDVRVGLDLGETLARLNSENSGRRGGFTVVDVADGANVYVRFVAFECAFSHVGWRRLLYFVGRKE